jgi:uncharacterized protein (TIGR03067 family)
MKWLRFLALVGLLVAGGMGLVSPAAAQKAGGEKKGLKELQGKWALVSVTVDGKAEDEDEFKDRFMVVKGSKASLLYKDKERSTSSLKIGRNQSPAHIDETAEDGPAKGTTLKGIYKLEGGQLTLCYGGIGKDRPTEFASKPGSGTMLFVCKKVK